MRFVLLERLGHAIVKADIADAEVSAAIPR